MRSITNRTVSKEPKWRHNRAELTTGYDPRYGSRRER
jgi:hydrogenase small subunit